MSKSSFKIKGFSSTAVHAGHNTESNHAHLTPVYASSTYVFDTAEQGMERFSGKQDGFIYSRWGNPNFDEAERKIGALESFGIVENGEPLQLKAVLHGSGMAAISTLMFGNLNAGDKVLTHYSLYGGTQELLTRILNKMNIEVIIADLRDLNLAEEKMKQNPQIKLLYIETPANPTIQCVDIGELSKLAKSHNITVACDNTFATPYLQHPFKYNVDYVVHSTTKFLNGHGTAVGGAIVGRDLEKMSTVFEKTKRLLGGSSSPFDAFMLVQGMKTLEVRMERHCSNAEKVAEFLNNHPQIAKVNYPGLTTHPDHKVALKQMKHPGPMMSFELKGGLEAGKKFIDGLKMCVRAVSLGTCDTLVSHPASMTHYGVPEADRIRYGITNGLIRMSVGIEDVNDIMADLDQALS
ncbi:MAG: aminotransferase class I/II-fold pyridoxal phosphate-dependent enzyme [Chitinophagaceae bacterium]|nr:aminotransferase class I/II-fold pyridoxal phosphate-dependent enzyme [Chitinophagaceae bacterium]